LVKAIEPTRVYEFNPVRFTLIVGLSFITTGMLAMILGIRDYYQQVKQIQSDRPILILESDRDFKLKR
jgi:putative membrane protein